MVKEPWSLEDVDSPLRRNFLEDAYKAYAEMLEKRSDELTEQEKADALVNHILERINNG